MEKETFKEKLSRTNVDVNGLSQHLGIDGIDIDDIDTYGTIEFALEPDYRSYGLDGIAVKVKRIEVDITWGMEAEYLTHTELERVKAAGGIEYRNGKVEGQLKISITDNDEWVIDTKDCEFSKNGGFTIGNVEFELGSKGKNHVTIS